MIKPTVGSKRYLEMFFFLEKKKEKTTAKRDLRTRT